MIRKFEIEVCVDSVESSVAAQECGAHRVELCTRLDLDGLTPNVDLIKQTRQSIDIDLHVIIRPREGDFTASEAELNQMLLSIEECKEAGVDGVVFGVLNAGDSLDLESMKTLIEAAQPMSITFHRAFDVCTNPILVVEQLQKLGVNRLLTSGQADKAVNGTELLEDLIWATTNIGLMTGGGVNAQNIPALWRAGMRQFHFTSHNRNKDGKNVFDKEKTIAAKKALESLCGI
ncbi:copper homeostasis protein CutC [Flavobacteriales bacterium]|nr:copper homeostasis protein CutC [Flavobacteriales bacterium]